jgi:hypothetical protein
MKISARKASALLLAAVVSMAVAACAPSSAAVTPAPAATTSTTGPAVSTAVPLPQATSLASATAETNAGALTATSVATATTEAMTTVAPATAAPAAVGTAAVGTAAVGTATVVTATGTEQSASALSNYTFTAVEYQFQGPASIPGGWTRLTLQNQGKQSHDLILAKLAAGKTITDVMGALAQNGPPDWVQMYGGVSAAPGQSASYVANLQAGNYVILSFGNNPQGLPDAAQGMVRQLTVTQPTSQTPESALPQAVATVDMVDYAFVITGTIPSGNQVVKFENTGSELHEADIQRLKPGKTMADVQKAIQSEMAGTPTPPDQLPVEMVSSLQLSPGLTVYSDVNLPAGNYLLVCFVPSPKNGGKPHAALGMVQSLTVK